MSLTKSVIYEVLRIQPPVPFQYGKAKEDIVVHSHDAAFQIKKGEMIFGYQPFATKDPRVFKNPEEFVGHRFVGEEGEKLLKYVFGQMGQRQRVRRLITSSVTERIWWCCCLEYSWSNSFYDTTRLQLRPERFLLGTSVKFKSLTKAGTTVWPRVLWLFRFVVSVECFDVGIRWPELVWVVILT